MQPQRLLAMLALLAGVVLTFSACCGGLADNPEARTSFIDSFNNQTPANCNLASNDAEIRNVTWTCKDQSLEQLKEGLKAGCSGYSLVNFKQVTVVGSDGELTCDVTKDCACGAEDADDDDKKKKKKDSKDSSKSKKKKR